MKDSNLSGQQMGAKGQLTRRRLLDVTRELLSSTALRDLRAVDIARRAKTSKATFYLYFENVEATALVLAEEAVQDAGPLIRAVEADWSESPKRGAEAFVRAYFDYYDRHRAVLRVQNLAVGEGDKAFAEVRYRLSTPLHIALSEKINRAQRPGPRDEAEDTITLAAVLIGGMERNAEGYPNYPPKFGVTRERLINSSVSVILAVLSPAGGASATGVEGRSGRKTPATAAP